MKQIRFITHDENHVDEETLINGVWAVTRCDCSLTNAALLPDSKEIDMYNGWTEPQSFIDARTMRRALNENARNLYLRQTTEADADALHDCIFAAEIADEQTQQAAEVEEILDVFGIKCDFRDCPNEAEFEGWYRVLDFALQPTGLIQKMRACKSHAKNLIGEIPETAQLPQSTNARDPFPQDAEARASRAREIALPNGRLIPYSSWNNSRRAKIVDDHEIHSYTADGENIPDDHWYHDNPNF